MLRVEVVQVLLDEGEEAAEHVLTPSIELIFFFKASLPCGIFDKETP